MRLPLMHVKVRLLLFGALMAGSGIVLGQNRIDVPTVPTRPSLLGVAPEAKPANNNATQPRTDTSVLRKGMDIFDTDAVKIVNGSIFINSDQLEFIIKRLLKQLNASNISGDYTNFWKLGSVNFRNKNSIEAISNAYIEYRKQKIDISDIIKQKINFSSPPNLDKDKKTLATVGSVDGATKKLNFQIFLVAEAGHWMLAGFSAGLVAKEARVREPEIEIGNWIISTDRIKTPGGSANN